MKKNLIFGFVFLIAIMMVSFASANVFSDTWGKITGNAAVSTEFDEGGVDNDVVEESKITPAIPEEPDEPDGEVFSVFLGLGDEETVTFRNRDVVYVMTEANEEYKISFDYVNSQEVVLNVNGNSQSMTPGTRSLMGDSLDFSLELVDINSPALFGLVKSSVTLILSYDSSETPVGTCGNGVCDESSRQSAVLSYEISGETISATGVLLDFDGKEYDVSISSLNEQVVGLKVNGLALSPMSEGASVVMDGLPIYVGDIKYSSQERISSEVTLYFGEGKWYCSEDCSEQPPTEEVTYRGVLELLNSCDAFEMGTAEPQNYFGRDYATGDDMCEWKGKQIGSNLVCISAGRVYSIDSSQTGYGVWSCGDRVVESPHNGWALCCPISL